MGLRSLIALVTVALTVGFVGCDSNKAQKIQPETRGKRGEQCLARNDCDEGLACLPLPGSATGICAKNEFDIDVSVAHCERVECTEDTDCCGERKTMAPAKCKERQNVCNTPTLEGCIQTTCSDTNPCEGGGTCGIGTCTGSPVGTACTTAGDCQDLCAANGYCTRNTNYPCATNEECPGFLNNDFVQCSGRSCDCSNPDYDPSDPICTDEDCEDICLLRCKEKLCVEDTSCMVDADCTAAAPICDGGRCVQCTEDDDCDTDAGETCQKGLCHRPCKFNEECGMFEECIKGDCEYVGCKSDRECVLAAARGLDGVDGAVPTASTSGGDDPRLFECLPSEADPDIKTCKIPCENDGSCGQFQVCDKGYCRFIGCENDEDCRAYLGISYQETSDLKPYVATAQCVDGSTN